jgi:hypothetical protein
MLTGRLTDRSFYRTWRWRIWTLGAKVLSGTPVMQQDPYVAWGLAGLIALNQS